MYPDRRCDAITPESKRPLGVRGCVPSKTPPGPSIRPTEELAGGPSSSSGCPEAMGGDRLDLCELLQPPAKPLEPEGELKPAVAP